MPAKLINARLPLTYTAPDLAEMVNAYLTLDPKGGKFSTGLIDTFR
ncbi:hypothetical protein KIPE111705_42935 [Kibdelosporangium persicum]|nr:hypothetical protein [Kibdelosporangium persicum]